VSEQENEKGHGRHAREQQKQLFQENPTPIPSLTFQQKLHGRPRYSSLPAKIDQVDQDGNRNQRQSDPQQRWKKGRHKFVRYSRGSA
jgi:hypothetical protein